MTIRKPALHPCRPRRRDRRPLRKMHIFRPGTMSVSFPTDYFVKTYARRRSFACFPSFTATSLPLKSAALPLPRFRLTASGTMLKAGRPSPVPSVSRSSLSDCAGESRVSLSENQHAGCMKRGESRGLTEVGMDGMKKSPEIYEKLALLRKRRYSCGHGPRQKSYHTTCSGLGSITGAHFVGERVVPGDRDGLRGREASQLLHPGTT